MYTLAPNVGGRKRGSTGTKKPKLLIQNVAGVYSSGPPRRGTDRIGEAMNIQTVWAMQGSVNHWWTSAAVGRMGTGIPKDEIPFWVTNLIETIRHETGETFDHESGQWSGDV